MSTPKHKKCKNCGNWVHPESRQCSFCGAPLRGSADWFSIFCIVVIFLVLAGLVVYAVLHRAPSVSKFRLPGIEQSAEPEAE